MDRGIELIPFEWRERCGVIGVVSRDGSAAERGIYGLQALQHRGQESAGIASASPVAGIRLHKGMGLVSEVFDQDTTGGLRSNIAIGHVLYSKGGLGGISDAEPLLFHYPWGDVAIATNGCLVNAEELRASLGASGAAFQTTSDAELVGCLLAKHGSGSLEDNIRQCMTELEGAYSAVIMTSGALVAMRDPRGFRPLCLGKFPGGWAVASESCALDVIGAELQGQVEPGEIVIIDEEGLRRVQGRPCFGRTMCIFEYVYFARPDSIIEGVNVSQARHEMGRMLAREHKDVQADIVVPVPEAGVEAGLGFARESGIPFEYGLVRNRYLGRTFIRPEPDARRLGVRLKLNAVRQAVQGKHVLVVDDSIVRGTTGTRLVRLLREAGAKSVGLMIASPPVTYPCYYGIGTTPASNQDLAASNGKRSVLKMTGADSLNYLSREGLLEAMKNAGAKDMGFCLGCFDGCYPVVAPGVAPGRSESLESPGNRGKGGTEGEAMVTYAEAGVDIDRGMKSVELIKEVLKKMPSDRLIGGLGGFGGSFVLDAGGPEDIVLVAGTDGVGTKLRIAIESNRHDTIGIDAVAMCVNDVVTSGAKPLFFLDYLAQGKIEPEKVQSIVSGVAEGCRRAGCVLLGGETAEMPGFYKGDDYDIAGFAVGAVERSKLIDGSGIQPGDTLIGLASSGLHSNGFSLARHILFDIACLNLSDEPIELGRPLVEELLEPTRIYAKSILSLAKSVEIRGLAHITGGGLIDNPPRMLPRGLAIRLDPGSWQIPPIFDFLKKLGNVEEHEMRRVFNMGLGFIVAVRPYDVDTALEALIASGERCYVVGQVIPGNGEVLFSNG